MHNESWPYSVLHCPWTHKVMILDSCILSPDHTLYFIAPDANLHIVIHVSILPCLRSVDALRSWYCETHLICSGLIYFHGRQILKCTARGLNANKHQKYDNQANKKIIQNKYYKQILSLTFAILNVTYFSSYYCRWLPQAAASTWWCPVHKRHLPHRRAPISWGWYGCNSSPTCPESDM